MAERWSAVKPYRDAFDMLSTATQSMLAEAGSMLTNATMPVLSSHDQFLGYLSSMSEIGMCPSVEQLLTGMID
jgi:gamma-glutamyl:cysteine ligase YbdK (ATP-grasp superfamily)